MTRTTDLRLLTLLLAVAAAAAGLGPTSASADSHGISVTLSGDNQSPPVTTTATGTFTYSAAEETFTWALSVEGSEIFAAHVHAGAPGETGGVALTLFTADPPVDMVTAEGTATATDLQGPFAGKTMGDFLAAAEAGSLYVNVHTSANPPGELRGQLGAAPAAPLTGSGLAASPAESSRSPVFLMLGLAFVLATAGASILLFGRRR